MKNLKSFDEFLNEANETIKAQGACKSAIFQVQKEVDKLFKLLIGKDLIQSYGSKVKPYNQGYEINLDITTDYRKSREKEEMYGKELMEFIYKLANNASIFLQPSSWFEENLESYEASSLEGKVLNYGYNVKYIDAYPKFEIKSKSDIDKAAKEFVTLNKDIIADIQKEITKLSK